MRCARQILKAISFAPAVRSPSNKRSLPATCRKKNTRRNQTLHMQTSLSRLPPPSFPPGEFLDHNGGRHSPKSVPSLRRTQLTNSTVLIAQTTSREKNSGPIKSLDAAVQAFVRHKKRGTTAHLCSLDDSIPVHRKTERCRSVTALPHFRCVRRSCRIFMCFSTVSVYRSNASNHSKIR